MRTAVMADVAARDSGRVGRAQNSQNLRADLMAGASLQTISAATFFGFARPGAAATLSTDGPSATGWTADDGATADPAFAGAPADVGANALLGLAIDATPNGAWFGIPLAPRDGMATVADTGRPALRIMPREGEAPAGGAPDPIEPIAANDTSPADDGIAPTGRIGAPAEAPPADVTAPADIDANPDLVSEDAAVGSPVGVIAWATDANAGDVVTYALTDDAGGLFTIDPTTGVVRVAGALDYETAASHEIEFAARSSDGSIARTRFTIDVADAAEHLRLPDGGVAFIDLATPELSVTGGDGDDAITGGVAGDSIDGGGGRDRIAGGAGDDTLRGGDGGDTLTGGAGSDALYGEAGRDALSGGDGDDLLDGGAGDDTLSGGAGGDALRGGDGMDALDGGDGDDRLDGGASDDVLTGGAGNDTVIGGDGDDVAVLSGNWRDYAVSYDPATGAYTLTDRRGDDGVDVVSGVETFRFADGDVAAADLLNDDPTGASLAGGALSEDAAPGALAGIVGAVDADAFDTHRFSLDDDAAGRFVIDAETGEIRLAPGARLDREAAATHDLVVRVTDAAGATAVSVVTISVTDVDEFDVTAPADADAAPDTLAEDAAVGAAVGVTAAAADADADDSVTYALADDAGGRFAIDAATGVVTLAGALDYETAASHEIEVRALSTDGSSAATRFTVTVTDVAETLQLADTGVTFVDSGVAETLIVGGAGADSITGHDAGAAIVGGAGDDTLIGGLGDDILIDSDGDAVVNAGAGDDIVLTGGGIDHVSGGAGNDVIATGGGNDTIDGGEGNDSLGGGSGGDRILGGAGDDRLTGEGGDDTLDGGDGTDTAVFIGAFADYGFVELPDGALTITDGRGVEGTDTVADIEFFEFDGVAYTLAEVRHEAALQANTAPAAPGSAGNAVDEDAAAGNVAATLSSADVDGDPITYVITDAAGNPVADADFEIVGNELRVKTGAALDYETAPTRTLHVKATDALEESAPTLIAIKINDAAEAIRLADGGASFTDTGVAETSITGGDGADVIVGHADGGALDGGAGDDSITGGAGDDAVSGASGADTLRGDAGNDSLSGGGDADHLLGGAGSDTLRGGDGDDTLDGGGDADTLTGGAGHDLLSGDDDDDWLRGEEGDDAIDGGGGDDKASWFGDLADFSVAWDTGTLDFTITDLNVADGLDEGADTVTGVETFIFDGVSYTAAEMRTEADRQANVAPTAIAFASGGVVNETVSDGGSIAAAYDPSGAAVATLATTDVNGGESHAYTLIADPSGKFEIVGDEVRVRAGQTIDFETDQSFALTIRTTDRFGATHDEALTLTVADFEGVATATPGSETITGTSEEDEISWSRGDGSNTIAGGDGFDTLIIRASVTEVHLRSNLRLNFDDVDGSGEVVAQSGFESIRFDDATWDMSNLIRGTNANDTITGGAADDVVTADQGDDLIDGGEGRDYIFAASGNDTLIGGAGDDYLFGGGDNDTLIGGAGNDFLDGYDQSDTVVYAGAVGDYVLTHDAVTGLYTVTDANLADGDEGADTIRDVETFRFNGVDYTAAQIVAYVDGSAPTAIGFASGGTVGETVADGGTIAAAYDPSGAVVATLTTTDASPGDTHAYTLVGDPSGKFEIVGDQIRVRAGQTFDHETDASYALTVRVADVNGSTHDETLTITVVDYEGAYTAGVAPASIVGTSEEDVAAGGAGDDTIAGGAGDDTIDGGAGDDSLLGGENDDSLLGGSGDDSMDGGAGDDTLRGGDGDDTLKGSAGDDLLQGDAGADTFLALSGSGDDTIAGGEGGVDDDVIDLSGFATAVAVTFSGDEAGTITDGARTIGFSEIERLILSGEGGVVDASADRTGVTIIGSGDAADSVSGGSGADYIDGWGGDDTIDGGAGDDSVFGGDGDDIVRGGAGDDYVAGYLGDDDLQGGDGTDTLEFEGDLSDFLITHDRDSDVFTITDQDAADGLDEGADTATGFETFSFNGVAYTAAEIQHVAALQANSAPTAPASSGDAVNENATAGTVAATLSSADANGDPITYVITDAGGNPVADADFEIVGNQLRVKQLASLDYETAPTRTLHVKAADALEESAPVQIAITVNDVAEAIQLADGGASFTDAGVAETSITGGDGADAITGHADGGDIDGGAGHDSITGGAGDDRIDGGDGDDLIRFGAGTDTIYGGLGDDTIDDAPEDVPTGGATYADGGAGDDLIYGGEGADTLLGGEGNDTVFGENGNDTLLGGDGNDRLDGGDENDRLQGGAGDDTLNGGSNDDVAVWAGDLADFSVVWNAGTSTFAITDLNAGDGLDEGADTVANVETFVFDGVSYSAAQMRDAAALQANSAPTAPTSTGNAAAENAAAGTVAATLASTDADNNPITYVITDAGGNPVTDADFEIVGNELRVKQGAALDYETATTRTLHVKAADALEESAPTQITITINDIAETIQLADGGASFTDAGVAETSITGGSGGDTIVANAAGGTVIDGAAGDDTITGGAGDDVLTGGDGDDALAGGAGDDTLTGGAGADSVAAGDGNDWLIGDPGDDTLDGGGWWDTVDYRADAAGVSVNLATGVATGATIGRDGLVSIERVLTGTGDDTLIGSAGDDQFESTGGDNYVDGGGSGNDQFYMGAGNDTMIGGSGDDRFAGGWGEDLVDYSRATSGVTVDLSVTGPQDTGGAGVDELEWIEHLVGSGHADALTGHGGANALDGGAGDDTLSGGDGDDTLTGGVGDDVIDGGNGTDTAVWTGALADYDLTDLGGGAFSVRDTRANGAQNEGTDTVANVESLAFGGVAYSAAELQTEIARRANDAPTDITYADGATAFAAEAVARFDDLGGGWFQRVFEHAVTADQNAYNVWMGQEYDADDMAFSVMDGAGVEHRLVAPNTIVEGETATWRAEVTDTGLMRIYKNGALVAEGQGIVPPDVERPIQKVGESNFSWDSPLVGEVSSIVVDFDPLAPVSENAAVGTVVGVAEGVDANPGDTLTFSLLDDAGGLFAIDAATGRITLAGALDYDAASSHTIRIEVADQWGATHVEEKTILVENETTPLSDLKIAGAPGLAATPEAADVIARMSAVGGEGAITWAITGGATNQFAIDAETGEIRLRPTALSFAEQTSGNNPFNGLSAGSHSAIAFGDLDGDGDLDAMVGDNDGNARYFQNTGSAEAPSFTNRGDLFGIDISGSDAIAPQLVDIDADGDLDLFLQEDDDELHFFRNTGTATNPSFAAPVEDPFGIADDDDNFRGQFADLDGDGDLDYLAGLDTGSFRYYQNVGTAQAPSFAAAAVNPLGLFDVGTNAAPTLFDMDNDGDLDLGVATSGGQLRYFLNTGSATAPVFSDMGVQGSLGTGSTGATIVDLDGDGDGDVVLSGSTSALRYFENRSTGVWTSTGVQAVTLEITATDSLGQSRMERILFQHGSSNAETIQGDGQDGVIYGGGGADTLRGEVGDDWMDGGIGNDQLWGGAGADTLVGGAGADRVFGGTGSDLADYSASTAGVTITISGTGGQMVASGGDAQNDTLDGIDDLIGSEHADVLTGYDQTWDGRTTSNILDGRGGNDQLFGLGGNDILIGGAGDDTLQGGDGDDTLAGGTGNDQLVDEDGSDIFTYGAGDGSDIVQAGGGWTDVIQLDGMSGPIAVNGGAVTGAGWTMVLDGGHGVVSSGGGVIDLTADAQGVITFDDGGSLTFQEVERIAY